MQFLVFPAFSFAVNDFCFIAEDKKEENASYGGDNCL